MKREGKKRHLNTESERKMYRLQTFIKRKTKSQMYLKTGREKKKDDKRGKKDIFEDRGREKLMGCRHEEKGKQ